MSDKSDDFLSFEKALRELKMRSEELKKLVSEGEIRAFRDGDSMKFRAEDVQALCAKASGDAELSFADSLEDDTGMVTEQLTEEDTLLVEEEAVTDKPKRAATAARATRTTAVATVGAAKEPGWVTAVAVLGAIVMVWGFWISFHIAKEASPKDSPITSLWAK